MSKGVKCSWVDMRKIEEALSAEERGDGDRYAHMRCVDKSTVSDWRAAIQVMRAIDGKVGISQLEDFQPSHAKELARHYRRKEKDWSEDTKEEIAGWAEQCESGAWTVQQLRARLRATARQTDQRKETCTVDDLQKLVTAGMKFGTVYADPPWRYGNQGTRASTSNHYVERDEDDPDSPFDMSVEEIAALPIAELAAESSHLHLWTTNAFLFECPRILAAWGFEYKSMFVWVKPQMGIGNYWRVSHEFMVLGVRGGLTFDDHSRKSWLEAERGRHSSKPEQVKLMIEEVSPGPRLELFGRIPTSGWITWGNDIERDTFESYLSRAI